MTAEASCPNWTQRSPLFFVSKMMMFMPQDNLAVVNSKVKYFIERKHGSSSSLSTRFIWNIHILLYRLHGTAKGWRSNWFVLVLAQFSLILTVIFTFHDISIRKDEIIEPIMKPLQHCNETENLFCLILSALLLPTFWPKICDFKRLYSLFE